MALNWEAVDRLAKAHLAVDPVATEELLTRQLQVWWCIKYNRPFKDPMIQTYTLDELVYEYLTWYYMDPNNDPVEKARKEQQAKEDEEWAMSQIKKASEEKAAAQAQKQAIANLPELPELSTRFDK